MPAQAGQSDADVSNQERAFGDYGPGRWAWLFGEVEPLSEPVPMKGHLSIWAIREPAV